jgi:hypothetical protein
VGSSILTEEAEEAAQGAGGVQAGMKRTLGGTAESAWPVVRIFGAVSPYLFDLRVSVLYLPAASATAIIPVFRCYGNVLQASTASKKLAGTSRMTQVITTSRSQG